MTTDAEVLGRDAAQRLVWAAVTTIEPGLSPAELDLIEERFKFHFAEDHRAFLSCGLPVGNRWPAWRRPESDELADQLAWPTDGVLFDVEHNSFWVDAWGPRPTGVAERTAQARIQLASVPQMVPVFGHRYLPSGRGTFGHPVLSMYQTDIIYYGANLQDYMKREFGGAGFPLDEYPEVTLPFWADLLS